MENKRIIYTTPEGTLAVVIPAPGVTLEQVMKAVPADALHEVVDVADVPSDRTFRSAWQHDKTTSPRKVAVDVVKAKDITHGRRRAKRDAEMAPHDEIIMKQIPGKSAQAAENERQKIRNKHGAIQVDIDAAADDVELKAIIDREGL